MTDRLAGRGAMQPTRERSELAGYLSECVHGALMGTVHADPHIFFDGPIEGVTFKASKVAEHTVDTVLRALERRGYVIERQLCDYTIHDDTLDEGWRCCDEPADGFVGVDNTPYCAAHIDEMQAREEAST